MATFATGLGRISVDVGGGNPSTPVVYNLLMPLASTEYSYALPAGTTRYLMKTRSGAKLRLSFIANDTSSNYFTVPSHNWYADSDVNSTASITVYVRCESPNEILEIISWG
jgi:hypothetical protein